jgi:ketosteroid isomerase-like protein
VARQLARLDVMLLRDCRRVTLKFGDPRTEGSDFQTEILDKLALRDGKIIEFVEFADTQVLGVSSS